jgi:trimethylamine--corrinoid protein Co-methyltransferase
VADTYQTAAMLANTTKPLLLVSYGVGGLVDAVEMAEAVVGGAEALREKPLLTCYINVVSGAVHNAEGLQKLLYLAGKGLPAIYIPGSNAGITSPMTMPGAVALDNAGVLLGLTLSQLKREGAPFIVSAMDPAGLDMRTFVSPYAYPERGIIRSLAQRYGLPSLALSGASDSKLEDQQASAEAALTLMADVFFGGNLVHDLGYLESGLTFSFVQLVICDQLVSWIKAFFGDLEVSEETLALDVIREVGPGGQYLKHRHTRRHYRKHWYPDLFERGNYTDWVRSGGLTLAERAAERVQILLDEHHPEPLGEEVRSRLDGIVRIRAATR